MNHSAKHLDNGFYLISDKAAGTLVAVIGQKLPKHGWEKFVMLKTADGRALNAWLSRTDTRHSMRVKNARGWHWAVHGLRCDGPTVCGISSTPTLGASFTFTPVSSTATQAAA